MSLDDKNIIKRIRIGDKKALEEVYWLYCDELHQLAFKFLRDEQLAKDAVQDIFIKLWLNRLNLNNQKSLKGFLFVSLKNHVLNMLKINKRRVLRQFEYARINTAVSESADEGVIHSELQFLINQCLQKLPAVKRQVYILKRAGDYTNDEIAAKLGLTVNTVKSHYYLACKSMREYLSVYQKLP
jgi:RNA polymerase sigma-70 factor (family 1)